jgi:hypothetical protein
MPSLGIIIVVDNKTEGAPLAHGGHRDDCFLFSTWREGRDETVILDEHHPLVDLHVRAILVQLSQIDHGVP